MKSFVNPPKPLNPETQSLHLRQAGVDLRVVTPTNGLRVHRVSFCPDRPEAVTEHLSLPHTQEPFQEEHSTPLSPARPPGESLRATNHVRLLLSLQGSCSKDLSHALLEGRYSPLFRKTNPEPLTPNPNEGEPDIMPVTHGRSQTHAVRRVLEGLWVRSCNV